MSTGATFARVTASRAACTNDRSAGNCAISEEWETNTRLVIITPAPTACSQA